MSDYFMLYISRWNKYKLRDLETDKKVENANKFNLNQLNKTSFIIIQFMVYIKEI